MLGFIEPDKRNDGRFAARIVFLEEDLSDDQKRPKGRKKKGRWGRGLEGVEPATGDRGEEPENTF